VFVNTMLDAVNRLGKIIYLAQPYNTERIEIDFYTGDIVVKGIWDCSEDDCPWTIRGCWRLGTGGCARFEDLFLRIQELFPGAKHVEEGSSGLEPVLRVPWPETVEENRQS
jgi:hypothetical protein